MPNKHGKLEYIETVHWVTQGGGGGAPDPSRKMSEKVYKCKRCGEKARISVLEMYDCDPDGSIRARKDADWKAKQKFKEYANITYIISFVVIFGYLIISSTPSEESFSSAIVKSLCLVFAPLIAPYILFPVAYPLVSLARWYLKYGLPDE
jgi:hypothetical protein